MIATSIDLIFQDVAGYGQIVYKHFMLFWLLSDVLFFSFRAFSDIETLYFRESGKTYKKFNDYLELTGYIYDVTATFFGFYLYGLDIVITIYVLCIALIRMKKK